MAESLDIYTGINMASTTKQLKVRRAIRKANAGKKRKNAAKNNGSTAADLALNKPNAEELARKKA